MLGEMTVKTSTKARRAMLASLIAATTVMSTGCSSGGFSLASMNPFSKSNPAVTQPGPAEKTTETIASTTNGARNQITTLGTTAKSALGKTTNAVASVFQRDPLADEGEATDPLSLSHKPKNIGPEVFVANGQLWESTGDFNKAMESYSKALENEPNNPPALTSIARLHFRQGNHELAADFFQKAIAQSPQDAGLHNDLGLTLSKLGNHAGATQSLEKALAIAPGTSRYANNLASVKFEAGQAPAAYQVLATNNKPAVAHFNMAYLYFKNGQMNEAKGHLAEALKFKSAANGDTAVQRAVQRSGEMLARIDAAAAPIKQAAPQATIAGGQFLANPVAPVQQTSQSGTTENSVAPAASVAPSTAVAPSQTAVTTPAKTIPKTTTPMAPAMSAIEPPEIKTDVAPKSTTPRPTPIRPTAETSSQPSTSTPDKSSETTNDNAIPFALPTGFTGK